MKITSSFLKLQFFKAIKEESRGIQGSVGGVFGADGGVELK